MIKDEYEDGMDNLDRPPVDPEPERDNGGSGVIVVALLGFITAIMSFSMTVLKLAGIYEVSWWKVTAPLWIPSVVGVLACIAIVVVWVALWVAHKIHNWKGNQ